MHHTDVTTEKNLFLFIIILINLITVRLLSIQKKKLLKFFQFGTPIVFNR